MHTFYYDNLPCYIFFCGSCICWLSMVLFHWHNSCYVLLIVVYVWERVRAKQKIKIKESHGFPNVRFGGSLKSHIPEHQKNKTNADYNTVCMWSAYFYRNESKKWWTVSNKSRCNEAYFFPANSLSYSLNIYFLSRFIWICYHFFFVYVFSHISVSLSQTEHDCKRIYMYVGMNRMWMNQIQPQFWNVQIRM